MTKIGMILSVDMANIAPQLVTEFGSENSFRARDTGYFSGWTSKCDHEIIPSPIEGEDG